MSEEIKKDDAQDVKENNNPLGEDVPMVEGLPDGGVGIDFDDLLSLSSGMMENGVPRSSVIISLVTTSDGQIEHEDYADFEDAVNFYTSHGNTLVMESVFSNVSANKCLRKIIDMSREWIENADDQEYRDTKEFHLIITPMPLSGKILVDVRDPIYATIFPDKNSDTWKLILVFSISEQFGSIEFFLSEGVDIEGIAREVDQEILREIDRLDREYAELDDSVREMESHNEYEQFIKDNYDFDDSLYNPEEEAEEEEETKSILDPDYYENEEDDEYDDYDDYDDDDDYGEEEEKEEESGRKNDSWFRMSD